MAELTFKVTEGHWYWHGCGIATIQ